jgi:CRISPR-associated protein Cas2
MVVMTVEVVPPRLRGALTRWLVEVSPGVYAGRLSALVRDLLWKLSIEEAGLDGRVVQVYQTNNEQGFAIRMHGDSKRSVVDLDGLQLVANRHAAWRDWSEEETDRARR